MKVQKNNVVELTYELIVDGKLADKATQERPLGYIHGTHMLLPKFESEVEGKEPGDEFAFTLTPEEGYGTFDASRLFELPKAAFEIDGKVREDLLVVGQIIPMLSNTGQVVQGTVHEVKPDTVVMDFNHPMAGKTLNFSGKVVSVREATEKELKEGLHGEFLPQEEHECHCHKGEGGCEGHKDGECCHGEGHKDGECCHGEGHKDGECCHGEGKKDGECCHGNGDCHKE